MKIRIYQTMVESGYSEDLFLKGASLVKRIIVGNNRNTIDQTSRFIPPSIATSRQSQNTRSSTYTDNNNIYQYLIQKKNNINTNNKDYEARKVSSDIYR